MKKKILLISVSLAILLGLNVNAMASATSEKMVKIRFVGGIVLPILKIHVKKNGKDYCKRDLTAVAKRHCEVPVGSKIEINKVLVAGKVHFVDQCGAVIQKEDSNQTFNCFTDLDESVKCYREKSVQCKK